MGGLWAPGTLQALRIDDFKAPREVAPGALQTFNTYDFNDPGAPDTTHSNFDKNLIKI